MSAIDVFVIIIVAAVVAWAIWHFVKKKRCKGSFLACSKCDADCPLSRAAATEQKKD